MTILQQALHDLIEEYAHVIGEVSQHNPLLAKHIWSEGVSTVLVHCRKVLEISQNDDLVIDTLGEVMNLMPGLHDGLRDLEDILERSPLAEPKAVGPEVEEYNA